MFSARYNPWMRSVEMLADMVRRTRAPLADEHPAIVAERETLDRIGAGLGALRTARDTAVALAFRSVFTPPGDLTSGKGG
jgi:hypothetical protein